jgi:hypothetical protein
MKNKARLAVSLTTSALLGGGLASAGEKTPEASKAPAPQPAKVETQKLAVLSKGEVKKLLAGLEKTPEPAPRMGAMCYEMAMPPDRYEYVCPTCGEKTLYTREAAEVVGIDLSACRFHFERMPHKEAMTLDESAFCQKCRPEGKYPELVLTIRFDDGTSKVIRGVTRRDMELLEAALKGETHIDGPGEMKAVKDGLPRLQELLGVKE